MEVCLQGEGEDMIISEGPEGNQMAGQSTGGSKGDALPHVIEFMNANPTAKIVYILETHSLDNGFLAYTGDSAKSYLACSLEEVSIASTYAFPWTNIFIEIIRDCTPPEIYGFLAPGEAGVSHSHKSLILNLSCGSSIGMKDSRRSLLRG